MTQIDTPKDSRKFALQHTICSHEVSFNQKLAIPVLMGILQEISYRHSESNGWGWSVLSKKNQFWVLFRIQLEFTKYPKWNDEIQLDTWTNGTNGLFGSRNWNMCSGQGDVYIQGNSDWVVIDGDSRKLQRLDLHSFDQWKTDETVLKKSPSKIPALKNGQLIGEYPIRISEIDLMQHVNNSNYVKWVMDAMGINWLLKYEPARLEVNFIKEAKYPNTLQVIHLKQSETEHLYSLISKEDQTEHVRIAIEWRSITPED